MEKITSYQKAIFIIFVFSICLIPIYLSIKNGKESNPLPVETGNHFVLPSENPEAKVANSGEAPQCAYCAAPLEEFLMTGALLLNVNTEIKPEDIPDISNQYDPVWGGFFISKTDLRKSLMKTAWEINSFALLNSKTDSDQFTPFLEDSVNYVLNFLSTPEGYFYTGQAADMVANGLMVRGTDFYHMDDTARRELGMPTIYRNVGIDSNALMVKALLNAGETLDRQEWIETAVKAGEAVSSLKSSFTPSETINLAHLYLDLYQCTGENMWLDESIKHARILLDSDVLADSVYNNEFNKEVLTLCLCNPDYRPAAAMVFSSLFHITDKPEFEIAAKTILKDVPFSAMVQKRITSYPLTVAVVGPGNDPMTRELRRQARVFFEPNKVVMTLDPVRDAERLEELPYHARPQPTLYACVETACSMPVSEPEKVERNLRRFVDKYLYKKDTGLKQFKLE